MVATRRGTRVEPRDEGESSAAEQTTVEVISSNSLMQTRRSVRKDGQTSESGGNEVESLVTSRSPLKSDTETHITTRSRRRNENSDVEVGEAKSSPSRTSTRSHSKQSLGELTDSTRKLRSHRSALITEPFMKSKEDAELSEAESHSSSVSTTTRRRQLRPSRSRKSLLPSEPTSDISDAESNASSVSGVKAIAIRSTRNSRAKHQSSLVSEPLKEQTSDAESCSSGYSLQPLARRSSRRNKSNLQSDEVEFVSETNQYDAQDQETLNKQSPKIHVVKSDALSSAGEKHVLSSPRRRLRNQPAIPEEEVVIVSDNEPESSDTMCEVLIVEPEVEESSVTKEVDSPVEDSAVSILQSSETHPEEKIIPDQMLQLSEDQMDEEPDTEKCHITNDNDATKERNENLQDAQESEHMAENMDICLYIDSDDSKSEHSDHDGDDDGDDRDDDDDDDSIMEVEEEDEEQVAEKPKTKKASTAQLQDIAGDGLFVIDTTPGVDSNKKYFLEPEDDKEDKIEAGEKGEIPRPDEDDDEDDDFIDEDDDVDEEETLLNSTQSSRVMSTSIDTGINLKEIGGLYITFDGAKPNPGPSLLNKMKGIKKKDELLQKSVITPDFEKKESVPPFSQSKHQLKKLRKKERNGTTGTGWFNMKAPQLTSELKNDLKALKMRSAMDPKHFYKKNDREGFPKYFQVGTVVDNPVDFYHSRVPKKQRKRTIVEELLADSEFRRYNKKKYMEIVSEKAARAAGKKNRKKKKFRK